MQKMLRSLCFIMLTVWTATVWGQGIGCTAPTIISTQSDSNKIKVNWLYNSIITVPVTFSVEFTATPITPTSVWTTAGIAPTGSTSYTVTGLTKCKQYAFRVKTNCSPTLSSIWSNIMTATTTGCNAAPICNAPILTTVTTDSTSATVNWTSSSAATSFIVEYVAPPITNTWTAVTATGNTKTITGLTKCKDYMFRVKAVCSLASSSAWSNVGSGKTKGCVLPCTPPIITNITSDSTSVKIIWNASGTTAPATSYTVEYTTSPITATSVWASATVTGTTTFTATGLTPCKEYVFRVKSNCSASASSVWSQLRSIMTTGCPPSCKTPTNLTNTATSNNTVFNWAGTATYFQVRIRAINNVNNWLVIDSIPTNTLTRTGLKPCTMYIWQVRGRCPNGSWTNWSVTKIFGTSCSKSQSLMTITPNPSHVLNIGYNLENEGKVTFDIIDIQGRVLKTIDVGQQFAGSNYFTDEGEDLETGVYFILMKVDNIQQEIYRWIKD